MNSTSPQASSALSMRRLVSVAAWLLSLSVTAHFAGAFSLNTQSSSSHHHHLRRSTTDDHPCASNFVLQVARTNFVSSKTGDDVYTIQILMSDTGGGHRASANALRDALDTLNPGKFECDIVDIYTDYGPFWPFNWYVPAYKLMAKYSWTWDLFYKFGETEFGLWVNDALLTTFCFEPFKKCMSRPSGSTSNRADMVISVHPLCQDLPLKILQDLDGGKDRTTPFITVVTDLGGAHKTWFNPGVDKCFVPSDVLNQKAQSRGLDPKSQIVQYGLPIRKGFWSSNGTLKSPQQSTSRRKRKIPFFSKEKADGSNTGKKNLYDDTLKRKLREELGLNTNLPTCLVVGGGDGMGGIVPISSTLGKKLGSSTSSDNLPQFQMVIVCGNNQEAKSTLKGMDWGDGVKVSVQGFVNNLDQWMKAADCLVTKAGPGTIAEASICGLPCMLFAYLPGQEEGNVPFVENAGFGKYSGDPNVIADTVSSWLVSPETMQSMKDAALAAARPTATLDIARDLADIAFSTRERTVAEEKVLVATR